MRENVLWTNLSRREISQRLHEMGTPAGRYVVRKLLKKSGMGQRTARKKKSMGAHPDRNVQFEKIAKLKTQYLANAEPVISIDTKKKEQIGNFSRDGHTHTQAPVQTLDHDFPSAGEGKLIPHGLYDLARNEGYMHLNTSSDTSEFCCDSVAHWRRQHGVKNYPHAKRTAVAVRWWGQQCLQQACLQGGAAETGRSTWPGYSHRALPAILLKAQSHRTSVVCTRHAGLPGRGVSYGGHSPEVHRNDENHHGFESDGRCLERGLRQRQKGRGRLPEKHADCLR
jgi:Rhodopirellula transposase DDE domain